MATITERGTPRTKSRGDNDSDTAVRIFDVVSTGDVNSEDDAMDVIEASAPPLLFGDPAGVAVGMQYKPGVTTGAYLYCKTVAARYIAVGYYEVTCNFSVGNYIPPIKPISLPWKYGWKTVTIESPFDRDINGNAIVNSALCPFSTLPTKRISYKALRITRNEGFYNYATYKTYENTVNSDTIELLQPDGETSTFGPGTIFCVSIEPANDYTKLDNWVQMVLNFEIWDLSTLPSSITDPFQLQLLDQGSMSYYSSTQKGNLYTAQGEECSTDQGLNGFGIPVDTALKVGVQAAAPVAQSSSPPGSTLLNPTAKAYYLKYKRYDSVAMLPLLTESR